MRIGTSTKPGPKRASIFGDGGSSGGAGRRGGWVTDGDWCSLMCGSRSEGVTPR